MKEIEILYKLETDIETSIKKVTEKMGPHTVSSVIDTYYKRHDLENLTPDEKGRLFASLRTRTKNEKNYITYKTDHFNDNDEWLYSDELETVVGDNLVLQNILKALYFEKLIVIDNTKYIFKNNEYEIVIEEVKELGTYIEIEYIGNNEFINHDEVENQKHLMRAYIESLGLIIGNEENAGKPELMLRKISSTIN